ncbi:FecR family protein [Steroidobacter agaridevorans]|uniref:FecR family protein n=1 Tax=Steroidobacter agaridevorans TaxID=2695856 RepID=UPI0013244B0C|nr:FecR domain-containing protein [Steroidobacter agaridevorans]GFE90382.1 iron dicitrate transporter FecR [Steroidobacter agaridevorans]
MSPTEASTSEPVPPERLAEASVWIAKLHGDARGRAVEDGLRRWLHAHPENARAFELATEVWEESEKLRSVVPFRPLTHVEHRPRRGGALLVAFACMLTLAVVGIVWFQYVGVVATAVGEQRQLVLEDGTRVFLNTDTRIVVKYDDTARRVELRRGEALFNVAKRSDWPFIVVAGDRQVKALGTSFVVRKDAERLAVTLVEGSVLVTPVLPSLPEQVQPTIDAPGAIEQTPATTAEAGGGQFKLAAGQRLTFSGGAATKLDTPSIDKTTAWRRGQVILDDTPLQTAVAEMNRYNETKLIVTDPEAAAIPINGLFQAGDSTHFANAVAQAYGLTVTARGDEIILSGKPVQ